jgi:hypothetical protein
MHRALLLTEIVERITSDLDSEGRDGLRALTALARTCRALSEPALDIVWSEALPCHLAPRMNEDLWTVKPHFADFWPPTQTLVGGRCVQSEDRPRADRTCFVSSA